MIRVPMGKGSAAPMFPANFAPWFDPCSPSAEGALVVTHFGPGSGLPATTGNGIRAASSIPEGSGIPPLLLRASHPDPHHPVHTEAVLHHPEAR